MRRKFLSTTSSPQNILALPRNLSVGQLRPHALRTNSFLDRLLLFLAHLPHSGSFFFQQHRDTGGRWTEEVDAAEGPMIRGFFVRSAVDPGLSDVDVCGFPIDRFGGDDSAR